MQGADLLVAQVDDSASCTEQYDERGLTMVLCNCGQPAAMRIWATWAIGSDDPNVAVDLCLACRQRFTPKSMPILYYCQDCGVATQFSDRRCAACSVARGFQHIATRLPPPSRCQSCGGMVDDGVFCRVCRTSERIDRRN
jgi:hypothetical protein